MGYFFFRTFDCQETIVGTVNGQDMTLAPRDNWFAYQGNEKVIVDGKYVIVVWPKVLDPSYSDQGKIWADDFDLPVRINIVLKHKITGVQEILECITYKGGKAHTYNKYPDNHPNNKWSVNATASFDVENGLLQTGIAYPNAENNNTEPQFAYIDATNHNIDSSSIEFIGRGLDFAPNDYYLLQIIVLNNN